MPTYLIVHSAPGSVTADQYQQPPQIQVGDDECMLDWGDITLEVMPGQTVLQLHVAGPNGPVSSYTTLDLPAETGTRITFAPDAAESKIVVNGQWPADAAMAYYAARDGRTLQRVCTEAEQQSQDAEAPQPSRPAVGPQIGATGAVPSASSPDADSAFGREQAANVEPVSPASPAADVHAESTESRSSAEPPFDTSGAARTMQPQPPVGEFGQEVNDASVANWAAEPDPATGSAFGEMTEDEPAVADVHSAPEEAPTSESEAAADVAAHDPAAEQDSQPEPVVAQASEPAESVVEQAAAPQSETQWAEPVVPAEAQPAPAAAPQQTSAPQPVGDERFRQPSAPAQQWQPEASAPQSHQPHAPQSQPAATQQQWQQPAPQQGWQQPAPQQNWQQPGQPQQASVPQQPMAPQHQQQWQQPAQPDMYGRANGTDTSVPTPQQFDQYARNTHEQAAAQQAAEREAAARAAAQQSMPDWQIAFQQGNAPQQQGHGQHQGYAQPQSAPAAPAQRPQQAGWYPDPNRRAEYRWFDGNVWTGYVATGGVQRYE